MPVLRKPATSHPSRRLVAFATQLFHALSADRTGEEPACPASGDAWNRVVAHKHDVWRAILHLTVDDSPQRMTVVVRPGHHRMVALCGRAVAMASAEAPAPRHAPKRLVGRLDSARQTEPNLGCPRKVR
jgi:hypothetical protein